MRAVLYTAFALTAFAFNSILCRLALRGLETDAVGFTLVRLASGALVLAAISAVVGRRSAASEARRVGGSWLSAFFLFAYAICFSLAYLGMTAGTGALVLFGSVQTTMVAVSLVRGARPKAIEWLGLAVAIAGLVYLVFPTLESPPPASSLLMAAAGAAWGFYTLRGRGSNDPVRETAGNFLRSVPMIVVAAIPFFAGLHLTSRGFVLAVLSGAAASGIGYTVWYAALKFHSATRAAVMQLSVPVLVGILGIVLLGEAATPRLGFAAALILSGIGLTVAGKR